MKQFKELYASKEKPSLLNVQSFDSDEVKKPFKGLVAAIPVQANSD
jgi:hypothetical protein